MAKIKAILTEMDNLLAQPMSPEATTSRVSLPEYYDNKPLINQQGKRCLIERLKIFFRNIDFSYMKTKLNDIKKIISGK